MLGTDGCLSMMNVRALFEPRAWMALAPDDRNEVLTGGLASKGANNYALLSRTRDGSLAIAYVPNLRAVAVDLGRLKAPIRARWYDPTAGTFADAVGSPFVATGPASFRRPGSNHAGDPDWILLLETAP
jgi:Putative collagen-binding domain of a collagenase